MENGKIITVKADPAQPKGPHYAMIIHKQGKVVAEQKEFQAFTTKLPEFNAPRGFEF